MVSSETNKQSGCFAVKVRSRAETTITGALRRKGYEVLLPTYTHRQRYSDRLKQIRRGLFPGYVFVRLNPERLLGVVTTEGVSYIVKSGNTLRALPPAEERLLESLAALPDHCEPCGFPQVGKAVQIRSGPLENQHGTLVRIGDRERLVVCLSSIASSVTVDLGGAAVESCDS